jgi:hypothetical protein
MTTLRSFLIEQVRIDQSKEQVDNKSAGYQSPEAMVLEPMLVTSIKSTGGHQPL